MGQMHVVGPMSLGRLTAWNPLGATVLSSQVFNMHTVGFLSGPEQGKNCIHMEELPEQGCWTPSRGEGCPSKHGSGTVSENKQCEKGFSSGRLPSMGVRIYMGYRKHPGGKGMQPGLV